MSRYYDVTNKQEWLRKLDTDPVPSGVVELPPENVFWSPLPEGEELTYDGAGLPNGTTPIVQTPEDELVEALAQANVTTRRMSNAMYFNSRGVPDVLSDFNDELDAVLLAQGATLEEAMDVLGG